MEDVQKELDLASEGESNVGGGGGFSAPVEPNVSTPPCARRAVATPQQSAPLLESAVDLDESKEPSQSQKLDGGDGEYVSLDMLLATKEAVTQALELVKNHMERTGMSIDDCDVGLSEQVMSHLPQPSNGVPSPCDGEVPQVTSLTMAGPGQGFLARQKVNCPICCRRASFVAK